MDIEKINLNFFSFKTKIGEIYYIWPSFVPDNDIQNNKGEIILINFIGLGEIAFNNYMDKIAKNFYKEELVIGESQNKYIESEICNYLEGKSKKININPHFLTGSDFEKSVWEKMMEVPYGETRSYREIACLVGKPKAYRATGTAIGKNPLLLLVPCHRVIKSSGEVGNFSSGIEVKKFLLDLEG